MTKRRLLLWSPFLVIFAAFAVWLEPTRVVWGWLRGEAFYQGRPTSYWRGELDRWECVRDRCGTELWTRTKSTMEPFLERFTKQVEFTSEARPRILQGDPLAQSVLEGLRNDRSQRVRRCVELGLSAIQIQEGTP
jgi:hypothetical protein